MENRHEDALRRIYQADDALKSEGREPDQFILHFSGEGPGILHARWDRSWAVPSQHTIDDLGELGYLRVQPSNNKKRSFTLTMDGRDKATDLMHKRVQSVTPASQPPEDLGLEEPGPGSIFVVHGHSRKDELALFLNNVTGRSPVVLSEKAGKGRTIIEKFEQESGDSAYAVVLMTSDDVGRSQKASEDQLTARARQNVVLELGYFIGKIGRNRVVALYDDGVELPSDYSGVEFIPFNGDWKTKLVRELNAAGFAINPAGI